MNYFAKNLESLKAKEPELVIRLQQMRPDSRVRTTRRGGVPVGIEIKCESGASAKFVKTDVPDGVKRLAEKKLFSFSEVIILLGIGLGETLVETLKSADSTSFVLLVESNPAHFRELLENFDLSEALSDPRVSISVGENPVDAVMTRLEREFGIFTRPNFQVLKNGLSVSCDTEYYQQVENVLSQLGIMARSTLKSICDLSGKWQKNILANLPYIIDSPNIRSLFGSMKSVPAVIVAAGPSLDKNCRWLEKAGESMLIICVDTAVKTLLKNGIRPHFVVSVDAKPENYFHLEGVDSSGYTLVANPVTCPLILSSHRGEIIVTSYTEPLVKWLEKFTGDLGTNLTGGSVATAAFDFALRLGCSPIILAGQDLAYTGGRSHSSGGQVEELLYKPPGQPLKPDEMNMRLLDMMELGRVEGNIGHTLYASQAMNAWKSWYEIRIGKESIDCINGTEGGAVIKGAKRMCLQEAVMKYMGRPANLRERIRRNITGRRAVDRSAIESGLSRLAEKAKEMKKLSSLGVKEAEWIQEAIQRRRPEEALANSFATCNGFVRAIMDENEFLQVIHWRLENTLNTIQKVHSSLKISDTRKSNFLNAESYVRFFLDVYNVSKDFEYSLRTYKKTTGKIPRARRHANVC